ncbi:DUF6274 family protein [Streptomyces pathocidini]
MAMSARHETRALLRAHLAAAAGYRHLTRHCPACRQLLRLAMESAPQESDAPSTPRETRGSRDEGCDGSHPRSFGSNDP